MSEVSLRGRVLRALAPTSMTVYRMIDTDVALRLCGESIVVPVSHGTGVRNLSIHPSEVLFVRLLQSLLGLRAGLVLDVGANIGRFLMYLIAADRSRAYLGFEPLIAGCAYVERLIASNGLRDHAVVPMALSDRSGVTTLWHNSGSDVCATTTEGFYGHSYHGRRSLVPCLDGDSVVSALGGPVGLVKIDVEGGELEALRGLGATIKRDRPLLIVEVIPPFAKSPDEALINRRRQRISALQALLNEWQYTPFKIVDGDRLEPRAGALDPGMSVDVLNMDYLCAPRELTEMLTQRVAVAS